MARQFALSCNSISLGLQARSERSGDKWLTHKVKISTSSVAIGPIPDYKNGSPSNLSAKRRIKGMGGASGWMMHISDTTILLLSSRFRSLPEPLITLKRLDQKWPPSKNTHDVAMIQSVERDFRQNISSGLRPGRSRSCATNPRNLRRSPWLCSKRQPFWELKDQVSNINDQRIAKRRAP